MFFRMTIGETYNKRKRRRYLLKNSSPNKLRKVNTPRRVLLEKIREQCK